MLARLKPWKTSRHTFPKSRKPSCMLNEGADFVGLSDKRKRRICAKDDSFRSCRREIPKDCTGGAFVVCGKSVLEGRHGDSIRSNRLRTACDSDRRRALLPRYGSEWAIG